MQKSICLLSLLGFLAFSYKAKTQTPQLTLPGFEKTQQIESSIKFVQEHQSDTAFKGVLVPDAFGAGGPQNFPYPTLFIHGLAGSSDSWAQVYQHLLNAGWSYGGRTAFCLESDGNFFYTNIITGSADIRNYANNVVGGDFFLLDFNIDRLGQPTPKTANLSAQAAIYKQGVGIRGAIASIIAATGRDKVILVCHSMGGLAARHYLQNSSYWQADGKHHVAKLVTLTTPHGGSNATAAVLSGIVNTIDEYSDAVRDLRRSYFYSGDPGVYLFGGLEAEKVMNDNFLGFKNYDVNCNGYTGDQIQGLNQKNIPTNVDYSCVVSDWAIDGDGIVGFTEQGLKNYYNLPLCETFQRDVFHSSITDEIQTIFEAFDEPDHYPLSYWIQPNTLYNGYITPQAADALYPTMDYDDYFFFMAQPGWVEVKLGNLALPFGVSILNADEAVLFDKEYNTLTASTGKVYLPSSGYYFLEVYAQANAQSWRYPYNFTLTRSGVTASDEPQGNISLSCYPNPARSTTSVSAHMEEATDGRMVLSSLDGKEVWVKRFDGHQVVQADIDLSNLATGVYVLTIQTPKGMVATKILKQ